MDVAEDVECPDPDAATAKGVERQVADDAVQPRPKGPLGVVLVPSPECLGEGVMRGVHRAVRVAQDRVRDAVDVVGVFAIRALDGFEAELVVDHMLSTRERPRTWHPGL